MKCILEYLSVFSVWKKFFGVILNFVSSLEVEIYLHLHMVKVIKWGWSEVMW